MLKIRVIFYSLVFISLIPFYANASSMNKQYSLRTISLLPVIDNVGGAEARKAERDLKFYLERDSRWSYRPSGQQMYALIDEKLASTNDESILKEFARSTGSDAMFRVVLERLPGSVKGKIILILGKTAELISERNFIVKAKSQFEDAPQSPDKPSTKEVMVQLIDEIDRLEQAYYFDGEISGRNGVSVTLSGLSRKVQIDEVVEVITIDQVERHPLIKLITKYETFPIGRIRITEIGRNVSYGRVVEEETLGTVIKTMKIKKISINTQSFSGRRNPRDPFNFHENETAKTPTFGQLKLGMLVGRQSRRATGSTGTTRATLSGLSFGALIDGELWITKHILAELIIGFGFQSGSLDTGQDKTLNHNIFGLLGEYRIYPLGYYLGPKIDLKFGYLKNSFSTEPLLSEEYGGGSFAGLTLGVSAKVPLNRKIGIEAGILLSPAAGYTNEAGATAGESGSALLFNLLGRYQISSIYSLFGGFRTSSFKADIGSSGEIQYSQIYFHGGLELGF